MPQDRTIRVFPDKDALAQAAAARVVEIAAESIAARSRFSLALSGGSTPRSLYALLAGPLAARIDWSRVDLWFGDERCVPHDHPESNARMARETLTGRVPIPPAHLHPVPTELPPDRAARQYERSFRAFDDAAPFDLALLGMGADGHTASLFPAGPELEERARWVVPAIAPPAYTVRDRVTVTLPAINASAHVMFLVAGADKAPALTRVLGEHPGLADALPASRVRCAGGVEWLVDRAAAPDLP